MALPREFSLEQQKQVVRKYCEFLTKHGYACTFAIHRDKKGNNPHAHILIVNRPMDEHGKFTARQKKEFVLDEAGNKVPIIDKATGEQKVYKGRKQWKRRQAERHILDTKDTFNYLRERWANVCNEQLQPDNHISEKSNKDRGIKLKPTLHEGHGPRAARIHKINEQIKADNALHIKATDELKKVYSQIYKLLIQPRKKKQHINAGNRAYLNRQRKVVKKLTSPTPAVTPPTATQAVTPQSVAQTEPLKKVEPAQQPTPPQQATAPTSPTQPQQPKKRVKPKRESPTEHIARMTQRAADHNASLKPQNNNRNRSL